MENSFQTSFIPKKPMVFTNVVRKEPINFFLVISIFLLIVSVLGSAFLFGYKMYLEKQNENLSGSLTIIRDSFEKGTIDELNLFYKKTTSAKEILAKHIALSPIFKLLGDITIPQVQYTSFSEKFNDKGALTVDLSGIAFDYRSIALQADVFNTAKGSSFKNVLFSNLIRNKDNNVSFNLKFDIDPAVFSYEKNLLLEETILLPESLENKTQ